MNRSNYYNLRQQQGIALFQVLLIAAMLAVMLFALQQHSDKQVALAYAVQQRTSVILEAETLQSQLELAILTQNTQSQNGWNLHNAPFSMGDFTVTIQDFSGLYSISSLGNGHLTPLFIVLGMPEDQANSVVTALAQWQQKVQPGITAVKGRHAPIQSLVELLQIPGITPAFYQQLAPLVTLYQRPFFNPMHAPEAILKALLQPELAQQVVQLRQQGQLTQNAFWRLTGIEASDVISYSNGPGYRVVLRYQDDTVGYTRLTEATLKANNDVPVTYWQRKRLDVAPDGVY